jgi:hypothetical protein
MDAATLFILSCWLVIEWAVNDGGGNGKLENCMSGENANGPAPSISSEQHALSNVARAIEQQQAACAIDQQQAACAIDQHVT